MENNYKEARARWAHNQGEVFLNALQKVGADAGVSITPMQYVKAYKLCIEEYKFGYPAEFKLAELISTDETYDQILATLSSLMKWFRIEFNKSIKAQTRRKKRRVGFAF